MKYKMAFFLVLSLFGIMMGFALALYPQIIVMNVYALVLVLGVCWTRQPALKMSSMEVYRFPTRMHYFKHVLHSIGYDTLFQFVALVGFLVVQTLVTLLRTNHGGVLGQLILNVLKGVGFYVTLLVFAPLYIAYRKPNAHHVISGLIIFLIIIAQGSVNPVVQFLNPFYDYFMFKDVSQFAYYTLKTSLVLLLSYWGFKYAYAKRSDLL